MALPHSALAFLEAMDRRYACKLYDGKPLSADQVSFILECGRRSPSSFGLEHCFFVSNEAMPDGAATCRREALFEACFSQDAVKTAGLVVAILVRRAAAYDPDSAFVVQRSCRFPGGHQVFKADYEGYHAFLKETGRLEEWARSQSYIACANMMTGAACAGIDSCAIEGYREEAVLAALGKDLAEWRVGILVVFGRAAEARREKFREPLESLVEHLD